MMAEQQCQLRYIDKQHAYCVCGGWHIVVEDWRCVSDDARMSLIEDAFGSHRGMRVVVTVNGAAVGEG
jgi:hypothetical protein